MDQLNAWKFCPKTKVFDRTGEFPQNPSSWIGITTPIASRSCELYGLQGASQAFEGKAYQLLEVMSFVRGIYSPVSSCIMSGV